MEPRKPKPEPAPQIEGGDVGEDKPMPAPAKPGGMIGEGAPDSGDGDCDGGMIGEG